MDIKQPNTMKQNNPTKDYRIIKYTYIATLITIGLLALIHTIQHPV